MTGIMRRRPCWNRRRYGTCSTWKSKCSSRGKSSSGLLIVPAAEHYVNNRDYTVRCFFIFKTAGSEVSNGRIVEFVGKKYNVTDHIDFLLKSYNQKRIAGFTGSILQYDVNYRPVTNTVYEQGEERGLSSSAFVQGGKKSKLLTSMMRASSDCMPVSPTVYGLPPGIGEDCVITVGFP